MYNFDQPSLFFSGKISPDSVVKKFQHLNYPLEGNVGLKVHSSEKGGQYFLRPEFLQKIYKHTKGNFIESNTAYELVEGNSRADTERHKKLLDYHGRPKEGRRVVIMDENPENNKNLTVENPAKYQII